MYSDVERIIIKEICNEFKSFSSMQLPLRSITSFTKWQVAIVATMDDFFKREVAISDYNMFIERLRNEFKPEIAERIKKEMTEQEYAEKDIREAMKKLDDTFEKIIEYQMAQIKEFEEAVKKIRASK